jgi:hypothetical protein
MIWTQSEVSGFIHSEQYPRCQLRQLSFLQHYQFQKVGAISPNSHLCSKYIRSVLFGAQDLSILRLEAERRVSAALPCPCISLRLLPRSMKERPLLRTWRYWFVSWAHLETIAVKGAERPCVCVCVCVCVSGIHRRQSPVSG